MNTTCLRLVHMPGLIGNKTLQACCDSLDCSRESAGHTRSHCITDIISDVKTIQSSLMQCDPVTAQSWKLQTFRLLPEFLNLHTYQYHSVSTVSTLLLSFIYLHLPHCLNNILKVYFMKLNCIAFKVLKIETFKKWF